MPVKRREPDDGDRTDHDQCTGGGFAVGTVTHSLHLVNVGWVVFADAPTWMNVYWTALTARDPLAAVLLIWKRPIGLALLFGFLLGAVGFLITEHDAREANR